jgi:hypothetical protein
LASARLDLLVRGLLMAGPRRALLRLIAGLPFFGALAILLQEESEASRRRRRRARHRHRTGNRKDSRKGERKGKRKCAKVGQRPKKRKRKRCCKGLVKNDKGRCAKSLTCGTGGPCMVFLTSTTQQGNLGGLTGADAICQQRAQAASLPGMYKAWLSDSTQSPATRFVQSSGPYRRVDGVTVAQNCAGLTDGTLDAPITVAENGVVFDDLGFRSWTHTLANGTAGGVLNEHCNNWTSALIGDDGDEGQVAATNDNWTDFASGTCNNEFHLYCFQQS